MPDLYPRKPSTLVVRIARVHEPALWPRFASRLFGGANRARALAPRAAFACAISLGMLFLACSSNKAPSPEAGGSSTGGSSTGGSGGASCANVSPCGGDVTGTWQVASSCLAVSDTLDLSPVGAPGCSAPITGSLAVTGTFTAKSDGTYLDNTITTGEEHFTLAPKCLVISSAPVTCEGISGIVKTLGYASVTCVSATGGGCSCSATVNQPGGIGVVSVAPSTASSYTRANNQLTLTNDAGESTYAYCAQPNKLTLTPQLATPKITGSIALDRGSSAAGGASGSGGATGSGGYGGIAGANGESGATSGQGGSSGRSGGAGASGSAGATSTSTSGPCDIYSRAGNPCVAAHSTVRALLGSYSGKLYQVRNAAGATKDILTLAP